MATLRWRLKILQDAEQRQVQYPAALTVEVVAEDRGPRPEALGWTSRKQNQKAEAESRSRSRRKEGGDIDRKEQGSSELRCPLSIRSRARMRTGSWSWSCGVLCECRMSRACGMGSGRGLPDLNEWLALVVCGVGTGIGTENPSPLRLRFWSSGLRSYHWCGFWH